MSENTAQRICFQTKGMKFGAAKRPAAVWTLYTPAAQRGACRCVVSIEQGGSEEVAKSVIMTLGPVK